MASQMGDNKLDNVSHVNSGDERDFINVYKKHEHVLKNKLEPFTRKIESLIAIWKALGQPEQQKLELGCIIQIVDWAKLHTLNIVLTGKWKIYKETDHYEVQLLEAVETTQSELLKISDMFSKKFQKLAEVIRNPWDDPVLEHLLHDGNAVIGQEEIDFFCVETAYLVSVRLKKLCESQCEDLALNLVTAFMNCYNLSQTQHFNLNATKTHILFCYDINIALLYKYNRMTEIVGMFKKLSLQDGLHLVQRFAKKRVKISKVWRSYPDITFLACQVFVTTAMTRAFNESGDILRALLNEWTSFSSEFNLIDKFVGSMRRIIQAATGAEHIYVCCETIHERFGLKMKTFAIELYIRALTTDMNNVESLRNENETEKLDETTKRLAHGFFNLADILKENIEVSRESALTAFSLDPTIEHFRKIEELAHLSGYNVLDTGQIWECKLHPPVKPDDDICYICNLCGNWMSKRNLDLRLTTNLALNEALNFKILGISPQLCDDLAVVLSGPRYHLLSWLLRWEDLHKLCELYLNDPERTKNLVTELKFVDIDYSMFAQIKKEPVDEYAGIERGYEGFLYNDDHNSDDHLSLNHFPTKSDPNTLKTLRMFRHNLNRNKTKSDPCNTNEQSSASSSTVDSHNSKAPEEKRMDSVESSITKEQFSCFQTHRSTEMNSLSNGTFMNSCSTSVTVNNENSDENVTTANIFEKLTSFQHSIQYKSREDQDYSQWSHLKNNSQSYSDGSVPKHELFKKYGFNEPPDQEVPPKKRQKSDLRNWRLRLPDKRSRSHKSSKQQLENTEKSKFVVRPKEESQVFCCNSSSQSGVRKIGLSASKMLDDVDENTLTDNSSDSSMDKANLEINGCLENIEKIYKYEKNISNKHKELKIILNRLSSKVIKSFIPSYNSECISDYLCGCEKKSMLSDENEHGESPLRTHREQKKMREKSSCEMNKKRFDESNQKVNMNCKRKCLTDRCIDNISNSKMNPRVMLERLRLPLDTAYARSVLSNVPGLNDFEMIRPGNVNHIVNVVQIPGNMVSSTASVQNTHVSTQISPHIQRIGQPKSEKPETVSEAKMNISTSTATPSSSSVKTTPSQSSTLINILSQQIIRPGQTNNMKSRSSPLINILSQQIIRPATPQTQNPKTVESPAKISGECSQDVVRTSSANVKTVVSTTTSGTILQFICKSTLPKFQQAFGKSVYTYKSDEASVSSSETVAEVKTSQAKTLSTNIQSIQGSVIYAKQMPAGQTINLIPPGRGHLFRIASSNSDQISLVKDTVIHSKMSALLAAALQGKPKTLSDGETEDSSQETKANVTTRPTLMAGARLVKPVLQIPSNVTRTSPQSSLSSTTLEQLREFDMVYKQVKERSSSTSVTEANSQESNENAHRISVTYVNSSTQKYAQLSPVVVVTSYCSLQNISSPTVSVTSQNNSPCVTPASTSAMPKICSKSSKGKTTKPLGQTSKTSPIVKPQHKLQEDEHTTQRIFDILAEYAEQLRNSPDLNNKPAPRRRSNPPTNPSQNAKRKKNSVSKKNCVSESDLDEQKTVGSEDSSCGVVQISVQEDEARVQTAERTESFTSTRQLILTEGSNNHGRNLIIADSSVGEALKIPNTAVLVPGNYIMPVSMVKSGQQIAVVSGGSKILATVPTRSGPNMLLFQSFLNHDKNKTIVPTVKYSSIQTVQSQSIVGDGESHVTVSQEHINSTVESPLLLKTIHNSHKVKSELSVLTLNTGSSTAVVNNSHTMTSSSDESKEESRQENQSHAAYERALPITTPVITQNSEIVKSSETQPSKPVITKSVARLQSLLVTSCPSNVPMLSTRKPVEMITSLPETTRSESIHNGERMSKVIESKQLQQSSSTSFLVNKPKRPANVLRLDRELHQLYIQRKQSVLDREMRLQKSLSEECEDLGVDEPSASELFPEADILFDASHSPSFDHCSLDPVKRCSAVQEKEETRSPDIASSVNRKVLTLFTEETGSASSRTAFLFGSLEYPDQECTQLTNGQGTTQKACFGDSESQTSTSEAEASVNSPVSPAPYQENLMQNKYKIQYRNKRKGERHKHIVDNWSSEPVTTCRQSCEYEENLEVGEEKTNESRSNEESLTKNEQNCDEMNCEDEYECEQSGRGARRSVKKMCSCCKGSPKENNSGSSRKRTSSISLQTPTPPKKAFLSKKR